MLFTSIFSSPNNVLHHSRQTHHLSPIQFAVCNAFNSLPDNKILDWFKLKAIADDKINTTEKLKFVLRWVENNVRKGENAGFQS